MSGDEAGLHLFGPVDNLQRFRDDGTAAPRLAPDPPTDTAPVLALAQGLDHRRLQPAARLGVDHGIDRLVAHAGLAVIGVHGPQCRGDLFGRPAECDKMAPDKAPQRAPRNELAPWPAEQPPTRMLLSASLRAIAALQHPTALQLPTNRARRPPKTPRDLPLARSPPSLGKNHRPLCTTQMTKPHETQPPQCTELKMLRSILESAFGKQILPTS